MLLDHLALILELLDFSVELTDLTDEFELCLVGLGFNLQWLIYLPLVAHLAALSRVDDFEGFLPGNYHIFGGGGVDPSVPHHFLGVGVFAIISLTH